jgi:hypothetical protein
VHQSAARVSSSASTACWSPAWTLNARSGYPPLAGRRFAATVRTVMRHYLARPDLDKVRHVAAVHHSVWLRRDITTDMDRLHKQIEEATASYTELAADLPAVQELYDQVDTVLYDLGHQGEGGAGCVGQTWLSG